MTTDVNKKMKGNSMDNSLEYVVGVTLFYYDGTNDSITVNRQEVDAESARYAVWHELKSIGEKLGVQYLTTTVGTYDNQ